MKYLKIGTLNKQNQEILTDNQKPVKVDKGLAMVWKMCDGLYSVDEIISEISEKTKHDPNEVKNEVFRAVAMLERSGVLKRADEKG